MVFVGDAYVTVTNGVWSATSDLVTGTYSGYDLPVSCASPTMCVAVSDRSIAYRWNGSTWVRSAELSDFHAGTFDVSCASATACRASQEDRRSGTFDGVWSYNGTAWSSRQKIGLQPSNISCATASFCVAGDYEGHIQTYR